MVNVGIIGCGKVATAHINALLKIPEAKISAVCDVDEERCRKFAEKTCANAYTSYEEMTDKEMIQYVSLIGKALEKGLPDIIAHPDLFLKYRREFGEKEEFITRQICELAQKYQVPMEINLNEIYREYVKEAFERGIKFFAFTDHMPFMKTKDTKTNVRMSYDEIDEYLQ